MGGIGSLYLTYSILFPALLHLQTGGLDPSGIEIGALELRLSSLPVGPKCHGESVPPVGPRAQNCDTEFEKL